VAATTALMTPAMWPALSQASWVMTLTQMAPIMIKALA
jgi:hypothetical protein